MRILIVDDDQSLLRALARRLRDHDVVALDDARVAVTRIDEGERFDFILSDLHMPHLDGMGFHRAVAEIDPAQAGVMAFMSGGARVKDLQFLHERSLNMLAKPFDLGELRALLDARAS